MKFCELKKLLNDKTVILKIVRDKILYTKINSNTDYYFDNHIVTSIDAVEHAGMYTDSGLIIKGGSYLQLILVPETI